MLALLFLVVMPEGALSAIGISLMFGVILTALMYMLAYASQHPPLLMAAKEELAALLLSIVIVVAWVGFVEPIISSLIFGIICMSGEELCRAAAPTGMYGAQLDFAYAALEIISTKLRTMYGTFYLFEILIGYLSVLSFPIGSPLPGVAIISLSITPFDGMSLLSNAHTTVVEAIGYLIGVVWAKQFIILFAKHVIPSILLPLGLVLRAFPWLRATGSSIIALSIVLYFIYPLAVIFSNYLIFDVYKPADFFYNPDVVGFYKTGSPEEQKEKIESHYTEGKEKIKELTDSMFDVRDMIGGEVKESCGTGIAGIACNIWNILKGIGSAVGSFFKTVYEIGKFMWSLGGDAFFSLFNKAFPSSAAVGLYNFIIEEVVTTSQLVILVVITSLFEIIIAITMYRNIASLIGGEVEIIGLSKLV